MARVKEQHAHMSQQRIYASYGRHGRHGKEQEFFDSPSPLAVNPRARIVLTKQPPA